MKDGDGKTGLLTAHGGFSEKFKYLKTYSIENLKKLDGSDDPDIVLRCATTKATKISEVDQGQKFDTVQLGMKMVTSVVIGFTDFNLWFYCPVHKGNARMHCSDCGENSAQNLQMDFRKVFKLKSL